MDIQKEKEAFEAWFESRYGAHFMQFSLDLDFYVDKHTQTCWEAWQAAKAQAVPEWISVKDKLPGFNQSVLSCDGFETCVAEYLESCKNEYGVFFEEGFWINGAASIFENVTHWMPLPEAIEAQEPAND